MRFEVDSETLSLILTLEKEDVNLDTTGVGRSVLDTAVVEIERAALREREPSGKHWTKLRPRTIARKGHDTIGIETGQMIRDLRHGDYDIGPGIARWSFPHGLTWTRTYYFHNGRKHQVPRPIIGWAPRAITAGRLAVTAAQFSDALQQPAGRIIGDIPTTAPDWQEGRSPAWTTSQA